MVTQIDEQEMPMIALAVDPARETDRLADVVETQLCAIVGTVGVHGRVLYFLVIPEDGNPAFLPAADKPAGPPHSQG
jgi:hypothetical protein